MNAARIVYMAAGASEDLQTQAKYAVMSALAWAPEAAVYLFTDQPAAFAELGQDVRLEPLPVQAANPFRLKLEVVLHAAERFADAPILFCDADTFFLRDAGPLISRIAHGDCVLHRREYGVPTEPTSQMRRFRSALERAAIALENDAAMWNSGVIGLPAGSADLLRHVLRLLDKIEPHTPKKYLAEQFSVSLALEQAGSLNAAEAFVFHYWYQKQDYTRAIRERLKVWNGLPLERALDALRRLPLQLPAPPQKLQWWERALIAAKLRERPTDPRGLIG